MRSGRRGTDPNASLWRVSVSVVIPTHNRAGLVVEAIASAQAQDLAPLEILVCDDASTDGTAETVREVAAGDPRVILLQTDRASGGAAAPRNLGIRHARGDWVAFLDDDDRWLAGKLARQAEHFGKADLVAGNARRRSTGAALLAAPRVEELWRENVLITSTVVARTELLRAASGFPERPGWRGIEDYGAWLALADAGARMVIIDEALADYRDEGEDRFGAQRRRHVHRQLASLHVHRWLRRPADVRRARAAANATYTAIAG